jgi:hypothetical protein
MSYLNIFITAISPDYVWLSAVAIILAIIGMKISNSIFMFTMIFFIIVFIGFEYTVYPEWLLALSILDMMVFAVLEKTHIFGVRI